VASYGRKPRCPMVESTRMVGSCSRPRARFARVAGVCVLSLGGLACNALLGNEEALLAPDATVPDAKTDASRAGHDGGGGDHAVVDGTDPDRIPDSQPCGDEHVCVPAPPGSTVYAVAMGAPPHCAGATKEVTLHSNEATCECACTPRTVSCSVEVPLFGSGDCSSAIGAIPVYNACTPALLDAGSFSISSLVTMGKKPDCIPAADEVLDGGTVVPRTITLCPLAATSGCSGSICEPVPGPGFLPGAYCIEVPGACPGSFAPYRELPAGAPLCGAGCTCSSSATCGAVASVTGYGDVGCTGASATLMPPMTCETATFGFSYLKATFPDSGVACVPSGTPTVASTTTLCCLGPPI
jgi:hypothetical protein